MTKAAILKPAAAVTATLAIGATTFLPASIYSSAGWILFWAAVGVFLIFSLCRMPIRRHAGSFMLHLSFLLIICGGGLTFLTSQHGTVRLLPTQKTDTFISSDNSVYRLPVEIRMVSIEIDHYEGMTFPRDFKTCLVTAKGDTINISMNRIGHLAAGPYGLDDYRIYQTACGADGSTTLTINHDPLGIIITYMGYFLFVVGGITVPVSKLRKRHLTNHIRSAAIIAAMLMSTAGMSAAAPAISQETADSLECRPVLFRGQIMPFETMARKVTLTLTGSEHVSEMNACRFVASLVVYSQEWKDVAFLKVKERPLRKALDLTTGYIAPSELYSDDGSYRLDELWNGGSGDLDAAIMRLDEKVALLGELWDGKLFSAASAADVKSISPARLFLMSRYDRCRPLFWLAVSAFACTVLATASAIRRKRGRRISKIITPATSTVAAWGCMAFIWHWIANGQPPFVNTSDILFFTSVMMAVASIFVTRQDLTTGAYSLAGCGALAMVAWLGTCTPQLTPLMPVLSSPWLSIHVSLVMTAYAILGISSIASLTALFRTAEDRRRICDITIGMTGWGVYLIGAGIWAGAMWANISWGRYWSWDPKETWALVTMLLYAIPLHKSMGLRAHPRLLCIYLAAASLSIVMTYVGVNYLASMHAYR